MRGGGAGDGDFAGVAAGAAGRATGAGAAARTTGAGRGGKGAGVLAAGASGAGAGRTGGGFAAASAALAASFSRAISVVDLTKIPAGMRDFAGSATTGGGAAGDDPRGNAIALLVKTLNLDAAVAGKLVDMGINSPAAFEGVVAEDLVGAGFTAEEAQDIIGRVAP